MKAKSMFVAATCMSIVFLAFSNLVFAYDIRITNDTNKDLSFVVNHRCSDYFGVIKSHSAKVISESNFKKACQYNPKHCIAEVFHSANCTGEHVVSLKINTKKGVEKILKLGRYACTWNDFSVMITSPIEKK